MDLKQLKQYTIEPVLKHLGLYSEEAVDLLIGTCCVESKAGQYIHQLGKGPACGIYQMEPTTARDIMDNFIRHKKELAEKVLSLMILSQSLEFNLINNNAFATALCRVHYLRKPSAIPKDLKGQAQYWKDHYNTYLGKGTVDGYLKSYTKV